MKPVTAPFGKMIYMPRPLTPTEPVDRFTMPTVRKAWAKLEAETVNRAAVRMRLTGRMMKLRRHGAEPGVFPPPIPVQGHYHGASSVYCGPELTLWRDSDFDLRTAAVEAKKLRGMVDRAVEVVQPVMLAVAAELLIADVMDLRPAEAKQAAAAVKRYRAEWAKTGKKPTEQPEVWAKCLRRLRNWQETAESTGFPAPLEVDADHRIAKSVYSLVELTEWLKRRKAAAES